MQPAISPIFNTRQMTDSLLKWSGSTLLSYDFLHAYWVANMMTRQSEFHDPVAFFDHMIQRGIFEPVTGIEKAEKENGKAAVQFNPASVKLRIVIRILLKLFYMNLLLLERAGNPITHGCRNYLIL